MLTTERGVKKLVEAQEVVLWQACKSSRVGLDHQKAGRGHGESVFTTAKRVGGL